MGVVIVALGKKAYVVWGENHYDYILIDNDSISWIAFCTASIAAGILHLIQCIRRNKNDGGTF